MERPPGAAEALAAALQRAVSIENLRMRAVEADLAQRLGGENFAEIGAFCYGAGAALQWAHGLRFDGWSNLTAPAAAAVREGLGEWADTSGGDALLTWAARDPAAAALRERWGDELARRAAEVLAPGRAWWEGDAPQPITDERLAELGGVPLAVGLALEALTEATRAQVQAGKPGADTGWSERWRVWLEWMGVRVGPVEGAGVLTSYTPGGRWLRALVADLWPGKWKDEAARVHGRASKTFALTTRTVEAVVAVLSPASRAEEHEHRIAVVDTGRAERGRMDEAALDGLRRLLEGRSGPVVDAGMVRRYAIQLIEAMQSYSGLAVFWHAGTVALDRYRRGEEARGEWDNWADYAGDVAAFAGVKLDPDRRRAICDTAWAGNLMQLKLWDGRWQRGLWTLRAPDPGKRGAPRRGENRSLTFQYADLLLPSWSAIENKDDRNRGTVLLGLPDRLPTVHVADPAQKAAALHFTLLMLADVCTGTRADAVAAGADITQAHLARRAELTGLRMDNARAQLRGMLEDGLLLDVGVDRYALGDERARALRAHERPRPPRRRNHG